ANNMKRKIVSIIISAVTVSAMAVQNFTTYTFADKISEETIKIMPIGDSITHGYQSSGGYRKYFCHWFGSDEKYNFDMVGPNSDYPNTYEHNGEIRTYDTDHCGYSGYAIQYMDGTETRQGILETLQDGNYLQTYDPDIIMLQIGTNDILSAYNDGITDRLENLINYIDENTSDDTVIFVSTIPYINAVEVYDWCWAYGDEKFSNTPEDFNVIINNYVDKYNASIPVLVDKLQDEGKNVEFADIYGRIDKETTIKKDNLLEDGVHPNEKAYNVIGLAWSGYIKEYFDTHDFIDEIESTAECPYRVSDLVSLSNYVLGRTNHQITEENYSLFDVNEDGLLDSFDLGLLRKLFIEKIIEEENSNHVIVGSHNGNVHY
ncbi:MAG: hypothetical protein K2J39_05910, partial [Ruminococcus sp.]|nr:hypothetical protein [Ruminococcus sp.]